MESNLCLLCRGLLPVAIASCCSLLFTVHQLGHGVAFGLIQCHRSGQYHRLISKSVERTFVNQSIGSMVHLVITLAQYILVH